MFLHKAIVLQEANSDLIFVPHLYWLNWATESIKFALWAVWRIDLVPFQSWCHFIKEIVMVAMVSHVVIFLFQRHESHWEQSPEGWREDGVARDPAEGSQAHCWGGWPQIWRGEFHLASVSGLKCTNGGPVLVQVASTKGQASFIMTTDCVHAFILFVLVAF